MNRIHFFRIPSIFRFSTANPPLFMIIYANRKYFSMDFLLEVKFYFKRVFMIRASAFTAYNCASGISLRALIYV